MVCFGSYLKDYLQFNHISQTEFATRLGISTKHMNEILNGKKNITLELAGDIERLTGIDSRFIIKIENGRKIENELIDKYGDLKKIKKDIYLNYKVNELKKLNWICFKDETNIIQECIDLLNFMKIRNFDVLDKMQEQVLFKKTGDDFIKLNLWLSRCDQLAESQNVEEYESEKFNLLISELKEYAYNNNNTDIEKIQKIFNSYGLFFVKEKAMSGTKVRGGFKVKGKNPAIYITDNYHGKDSLYYEIFHELGHCKSDYNEAQNKIIIEGNDVQEKKADKFALDTMISNKIWKEIIIDYNEQNLISISKKYRIPMSFIVGRLAKMKYIKYNENMYNKYSNN